MAQDIHEKLVHLSINAYRILLSIL